MVSIWVSSAFKNPSRAVTCCRTARTLHPKLLTLLYGLGALHQNKRNIQKNQTNCMFRVQRIRRRV